MGRYTLVLLLLLYPSIALGLTPIVRNNVVPYQHIEYGTTFKFGAVAFSKEGIEDVDFVVSGQGYSGGTKTATEMTYNDRSETYEYWVSISSSEFITDGTITVTTTATSNTSSDTKSLAALTLIAEATEAYSHTEAWVSTNSDGTGTVNDNEDPFPTLASAISAAQTANSGSSSDNIIYLEDGSYTLNSTISATTGWLTVTASSGSSKTEAKLTAGYPTATSGYLKLSGITIEKTTENQSEVIEDGSVDNLWVDDCRVIGVNRWYEYSNPIQWQATTTGHYITDSYYYDIYNVVKGVQLARGLSAEQIGNDVFFNAEFVVSSEVTDINPGTTLAHSDAYQIATSNTDLPDNRIVYGYKATDLSVQGTFATFEDHPSGTGTNCAFVNMLVEMREPSVGNPSHDFAPWAVGGNAWSHLLVWNNTFPLGVSYGTDTYSNSSFVGNVFWQFASASTSFADYGNSGGNDFLHNHFMFYAGGGSCTPTSADDYASKSCPRVSAVILDSDQTGTETTGGNIMDSGFAPLSDSGLLDRFTSLVPVDIDNNLRGVMSDVGVYEYINYPTQTGSFTGSF